MEAFEDKVAIVTGGASGMGRELCKEMGQAGAVVVAVDINAEAVQEVAADIAAAGGRARPVHLDVSREEGVHKLVEETAAEHGRLDYMFNNAGISVGADARDLTMEHWRWVLDTNLFGVLYGTNAAYALMAKQGFGHIVNTASLAGLIGYPANLPYATSKYAVIGLTTTLRAEAADLGVKVSVVCPGYIRTNIWYSTPILHADREKLLEMIPFKFMDANKAARAILRGVARNRAIIIFPFHARFLGWLQRLHPALLTPLSLRTIRGFRSLRTKP